MNMIELCWVYVQSAVLARTGDERGASFVEYSLLTALIAIVCLLAVGVIGTTTGDSLSTTGSRLTP